MSEQTYFEIPFQGPWKGIDVSMPENMLDPAATPNASNWIVRAGELRSRPRQSQILPQLPDKSQITGHTAFADSNNVIHTCVVSTSGLWQLSANWKNAPTSPKKVWALVQKFSGANFPAPANPVQFQLFVNNLFFVNGSPNVWNWGGITPNAFTIKSALNSVAIYDTTHGMSAGAYFIGELNFQVIILNTVEQVYQQGVQYFPQRVRWSASGLPYTYTYAQNGTPTLVGGWDPTVNTSAGYNDMLDVPDSITGFMTIGTTGFIFRVNGITEMTAINSGVLPFDFNHLWASERGIGNVYPWSIANYGPVGFFVATDDIYEVSLGGFQKVGGKARNAIYTDIGNAIAAPIASIFPSWNATYPYLTYQLSIPVSANECKVWNYFVEDQCWMPWPLTNFQQVGRARLVPTK